MSPGRGVVNFRLRPPSFVVWMAVLVFAVGWVFHAALKDSLPLSDQHWAKLPLYVGIALAGIILIGATAKWWYRHLWRNRQHHNLPSVSDSARRRHRRHRHSHDHAADSTPD